jgi:hypothetical protein
MACQNWISVLAEAEAGARAITAHRAQAHVAERKRVVVRGMAVLLVTNGSIGMPTPVTLPEACVDRVAGS